MLPTQIAHISDEVRRLQKLSALIACLQHAVNYDVSEERQVDVSDALAAVVLPAGRVRRAQRRPPATS